MNQEITRQIRVYGVVQGVGFRRQSAAMRLRGESVEMSVTKGLMSKSMRRGPKKL